MESFDSVPFFHSAGFHPAILSFRSDVIRLDEVGLCRGFTSRNTIARPIPNAGLAYSSNCWRCFIIVGKFLDAHAVNSCTMGTSSLPIGVRLYSTRGGISG